MVLVRSPALMFSTTSSTSWIGLVMPREITSVTTMLDKRSITIEKITNVRCCGLGDFGYRGVPATSAWTICQLSG